MKTLWSVDTRRRYLQIADEFHKDSGMRMDEWGMKSGRACLLDQLHTMHSAVAAANNSIGNAHLE